MVVHSLHAVNPPSTPSNFQSSSIGPTSITLTWSQAPGEVIDSYEIIYSFTVNNCSLRGDNVMRSVSGSLRQHNLTGLQEDSEHTIRITARNGAGPSAPAQTTATTPIAGRNIEVRNCNGGYLCL